VMGLRGVRNSKDTKKPRAGGAGQQRLFRRSVFFACDVTRTGDMVSTSNNKQVPFRTLAAATPRYETFNVR